MVMAIWPPLGHGDSVSAKPLGPLGEVHVVRASVLKLREIDGLLSRYVDGWENGQNPDELYPGLGYAALSGTDVVGIVLFYLTPSIVPAETLCFLSGAVDQLHRRRGVGSRLIMEVLSAARRAVAIPVLIASVPEREAEPAAAFLNRFDFAEMDCQVHCERRLIGLDPICEDVRFGIREYRGGSPALDRAIMDMHRRAYRARPCVPDLTDELLAHRLAQPSCYHKLLFHGRKLVGYASFWINGSECYVDSLAVTRRYWGSGASEILARSVEHFAAEHGCATLSTVITSSNLAIVSIMERHACHPVKTTRRFCRRFAN
jgi:GNAT superfamily N-acetyltransferase